MRHPPPSRLSSFHHVLIVRQGEQLALRPGPGHKPPPSLRARAPPKNPTTEVSAHPRTDITHHPFVPVAAERKRTRHWLGGHPAKGARLWQSHRGVTDACHSLRADCQRPGPRLYCTSISPPLPPSRGRNTKGPLEGLMPPPRPQIKASLKQHLCIGFHLFAAGACRIFWGGNNTAWSGLLIDD